MAHACSRHLGGPARLEELSRLSGGASAETWSFDLRRGDGREALILRRIEAGKRSSTSVDPETEAELQRLAHAGGVPVAAVRFVLEEADELGQGYVMERLEGETIPRRILRDGRFARVRATLARQCGEVLARLHRVDPSPVAGQLATLSGSDQLAHYRELHDSFGDPHPVFELAFRFLEERAPAAVEPVLVHGDFRNGNLMIDRHGLRAVLDWELAHLGDPMEDLGWLCVPSWRFGELDKPVGGFGGRDELFAGYEGASGAKVDREKVQWFEIFGALKWGVMCQLQGFAHLAGQSRSIEKAAIGRRASETEIDLLDAIEAFQTRADRPVSGS